MSSEKPEWFLRSECCNAIVSWVYKLGEKQPPTCQKCGQVVDMKARNWRAEDAYAPNDEVNP